MGKQDSKLQSDDIHRFATVKRMLAFAVVILLMMWDRGFAQAKTVWTFVGSGTIAHSDKGMSIISMLGAPVVGSVSAGNILLATGFGTYILVKGGVSAVSDLKQGVPATYSLSQNYPNPFNPSTTIEYGLPFASIVRLTVFDVLGRNVASLHDGEQAAGFHRLVWNAPVPTGVYFYRIDATSVRNPEQRLLQVKKMLLLK